MSLLGSSCDETEDYCYYDDESTAGSIQMVKGTAAHDGAGRLSNRNMMNAELLKKLKGSCQRGTGSS